MTPTKTSIENAQFKLFYLLMASDGKVTEHEKQMFLKIIKLNTQKTLTFAEAVFNGIHKFAHYLKYDAIIQDLKLGDVEQKDETIRILRELSFADKNLEAKEVTFILKVKKDLDLV